MTKTIAFVHHKGGTGKTTSCINIAGYLAKAGKKVLVADLDPQGNATAGLGVDKNSLEHSIYDVMSAGSSIRNIILRTDFDNLHIAPASTELAWMELNQKSVRLFSQFLTELHMCISNHAKSKKSDALLFDSLSTMLIYETESLVIKFIHSIVNTIRSYDMKAVFTILEGETDSALVKDLGMFVDKIIHYK